MSRSVRVRVRVLAPVTRAFERAPCLCEPEGGPACPGGGGRGAGRGGR